MRAGYPLVLYWIGPDGQRDGSRQALCGDTSTAWRRIDGDNLTAAECDRCASEAARRVQYGGPLGRRHGCLASRTGRNIDPVPPLI
jgi:hypothetical protein